MCSLLARMGQLRPIACGLLLLASAFADRNALAQTSTRRTERITIDVVVTQFETRRVTPCGEMGAQPRNASARVESVVEGSFVASSILLSWPVCEWEHVTVGDRFRITIRRFTGGNDDPIRTRYLVRDARPLMAPFRHRRRPSPKADALVDRPLKARTAPEL